MGGANAPGYAATYHKLFGVPLSQAPDGSSFVTHWMVGGAEYLACCLISTHAVDAPMLQCRHSCTAAQSSATAGMERSAMSASAVAAESNHCTSVGGVSAIPAGVPQLGNGQQQQRQRQPLRRQRQHCRFCRRGVRRSVSRHPASRSVTAKTKQHLHARASPSPVGKCQASAACWCYTAASQHL